MPVALKIIALIVGIFMFLGSVFDWDFIVNGRREQRLHPLIGRLGIRLFYGFIGFSTIISIILLFNVF